MSKSCSVICFFLAGCSLILIHSLMFPTNHGGPLIVDGSVGPVRFLGLAASVVETSDNHTPKSSGVAQATRTETGLQDVEASLDNRTHNDIWKKGARNGKVDNLFASSFHGSSDVDEPDYEQQYGGGVDDESIADMWLRSEEVDAWRRYEEEYSTMKWERRPEAYKRWRNGLEMYGVQSRKNFLVTHDSVDFRQVLPFYMSTQHTYTVSELFMRLIPKESPYDKPSVGRCAVVGNSGNLQHSGCGKQIDSADYVFRCNIPPLDEFEDDVGVKTNLTTMNPSMFIFDHGTVSLTRKPDIPFNLVLEPYDGVIILPCFSHFFYLRHCIKVLKQYYRDNANMTFLHPEHFMNVWDYWKDHGLENLPSTGFYIVSTAATLCDQIDLYGFWPFDGTGFGGRSEHVMYHYWEDGQWGPVHDKSGEFAFLFNMHREGKLRLHLGNCSTSGLS